MADSYTYIPKPTGANYTDVNAVGKQQYDQATLTYDDSSTFYDGIDIFAYTNVAKPTGSQIIIRKGTATGLMIPLTYAKDFTVGKSPYTFIGKPTI